MKLTIDFGAPIWEEESILSIAPEDLDDYYAAASEVERLNLFFVLEASLHRLQAEKRMAAAAHCAFLMAYYVFVPLTPPASCELAGYYMDMALQWKAKPEWREWKRRIEQGN